MTVRPSSLVVLLALAPLAACDGPGGASITPGKAKTLEAGGLALGGSHTCAIMKDDTVRCWGRNAAGQLGPDEAGACATADATAWPRSVGQLKVADLSAGELHTCAVGQDGVVSCWGGNAHQQLGGAPSNACAPVAVAAVTGATDVAAGDRHSCAVDGEGAAWCWGDNTRRQLGAPTTDEHGPVKVELQTKVTRVGAGAEHSCAVLEVGLVACWGRNHRGQLGVGNLEDGDTPRQVLGLQGGVSVALGRAHTCALDGAGAVHCWGANDRGQLGQGAGSLDSSVPRRVGELTGLLGLTSGADHVCAITAEREVLCWGAADQGQVGPGASADAHQPVAVPGPTGVVALDAGAHHTCAAGDGGQVWCWGAAAPLGVEDGAAFSADPVLVEWTKPEQPAEPDADTHQDTHQPPADTVVKPDVTADVGPVDDAGPIGSETAWTVCETDTDCSSFEYCMPPLTGLAPMCLPACGSGTPHVEVCPPGPGHAESFCFDGVCAMACWTGDPSCPSGMTCQEGPDWGGEGLCGYAF